MRNALLINDTSGESNPGCRAVSATLKKMLEAGNYNVTSIPLGYWAAEFKALDDVHRRALTYAGSTFPHWTADAVDFDIAAWEGLRFHLQEKDDFLTTVFSKASLVIINGEGSLHHNFPRGLALLALAESAKNRDLTVNLVNCTVQAMSRTLLDKVLRRLDLIHVREPRSFEEVSLFTTRPVRLSIDVAFGAAFSPATGFDGRPDPRCLLTSGVGVHPKYLAAQIEALRSTNWEPVYLLIGDGGERGVCEEVCGSLSVDVISAADIAWQEFPNFLSRFPFAVSGRHHINIFLMCAGVPFIPLPSNTWKIEETLQFVNYPIQPVKTIEALMYEASNAHARLEELAVASAIAGSLGKSLVKNIM